MKLQDKNKGQLLSQDFFSDLEIRLFFLSKKNLSMM